MSGHSDLAGERYGLRGFLRDLPGQLREVRRDARQLASSVVDLWPLTWTVNADRKIEFYSQQAFDSGREFGRREIGQGDVEPVTEK